MGKACRVKLSTQTHRKRKGFNGTKNVVNNNVNNVNQTVNIVNTPSPSSTTPLKTLVQLTSSTTTSTNIATATVSMKKVVPIADNQQIQHDKVCGYRIVDISILGSIFQELRCP